MKKRRISRLKAGESVFKSTGISYVKVSNEGEIECLEIPIRSTGVSELIDRFQRKAPQPPIERVLVDPANDKDGLAKELGLAKKTWISIPNYSDRDYIERKDKHDSDMGIAIVIQGLDIELVDENDKPIEDDDKKVNVLKSMGLTGEQFSQLVGDITSLTRWSEDEKIDFFAMKSDSVILQSETSQLNQ